MCRFFGESKVALCVVYKLLPVINLCTNAFAMPGIATGLQFSLLASLTVLTQSQELYVLLSVFSSRSLNEMMLIRAKEKQLRLETTFFFPLWFSWQKYP